MENSNVRYSGRSGRYSESPSNTNSYYLDSRTSQSSFFNGNQQDNFEFYYNNLDQFMQLAENTNTTHNTNEIERNNEDKSESYDNSFQILEEMSIISNKNKGNNKNHENDTKEYCETLSISDDSSIENDNADTEIIINKKKRCTSAPVKSISENEEFKWGNQFLNLEKAVMFSNRLIYRNDNKFDLDSEVGLNFFKFFFEVLEKLIMSLKIKTENRDYRKNFSKAYSYLYKQGKLCYLTEIIDSAQEGMPNLWVNGENYSFSNETLKNGTILNEGFKNLLSKIKTCYKRVCYDSFFENIHNIKVDLISTLENFDKKWVNYERKYITELIEIENQARKFVLLSIKSDKEILSFENNARSRGKILLDSEDYNNQREKLVGYINEMNKIANIDGKGRDDLGIEILLAAEGIFRRISKNQSLSIRHLASKVKQTFTEMKILLRKYDENIDIVDPQLKNNQDLVECLWNWETAWEKGKEYLLSSKKCSQLISFSQIIDILLDKYRDSYSIICEQIESRDPNIFVWIPSILILKSFFNEDEEICKYYFPELFENDKENGRLYSMANKILKELEKNFKDSFELYNNLEMMILIQENSCENELKKFDSYNSVKQVNEFLKIIKTLAMQLQRTKPIEWNNFFDLAINFLETENE